MNDSPNGTSSTAATSRTRLLWTTLIALIAAAVLLITIVLPAEFGIDPLGSGRLLGLTDMAEPDVHTEQAQSFRNDEVTFILSPFQSVEYKYEMEEGAAMIYTWQATGVLTYDLHAEPDVAAGYPEDFEISADAGRETERNGSYIAPFAGIHGWFWENRGAEDVTITLTAAVFSDTAIEYSGGRQIPRTLPQR